MKTLLSLIAGSCLLTLSTEAATVAAWTFESPNAPGTFTGSTVTGVLPNIGSGIAAGFHANSATVFTSAVGNGSATSWAANQWSVGDYWQFQTSTLGFEDIQLTLAQRATTTGPTNFSLAFSLDGTTFTTAVAQYGVRSDLNFGAWDSSTPNSLTVRNFNLSSYTQLDNASTVYFRVRFNLPGLGGGSGEGRIDDFQVLATAVPEPTAVTLLGLATLMCRWLKSSKPQNN